MAKSKKQARSRSAGRSERIKLTHGESLKRMQAFDKRKEAFVGAVRRSLRVLSNSGLGDES
jgi:hypothetical protein